VYLDWLTGRWEGLAERVRQLTGYEEGQIFPWEAMLVDGLLAAASGDAGAAAGKFRLTLAQKGYAHLARTMMEPAAALAWLELAAGRPEVALAVTQQPVSVVTAKGIWLWAAEVGPARVAALTSAGQVAEAAELVSAFGQGLRGRDFPAARAGLTLARAILAEAADEPVRAAAAYGRAAAAWQKLPRPYDALLARERQGRCLLAAGRAEAGITQLQVVALELARMGARGDAVRVSQTLRQYGVAVKQPRGGRPSYGGRLSPRELEVARLLVDGQTNREIGYRLFLSPKTVARHIESAMRKLDVSSRTALAVRLVETGLVQARGYATVIDGGALRCPSAGPVAMTGPADLDCPPTFR
jgi:DNA-binding NarL/FixJ family response regulator